MTPCCCKYQIVFIKILKFDASEMQKFEGENSLKKGNLSIGYCRLRGFDLLKSTSYNMALVTLRKYLNYKLVELSILCNN